MSPVASGGGCSGASERIGGARSRVRALGSAGPPRVRWQGRGGGETPRPVIPPDGSTACPDAGTPTRRTRRWMRPRRDRGRPWTAAETCPASPQATTSLTRNRVWTRHALRVRERGAAAKNRRPAATPRSCTRTPRSGPRVGSDQGASGLVLGRQKRRGSGPDGRLERTGFRPALGAIWRPLSRGERADLDTPWCDGMGGGFVSFLRRSGPHRKARSHMRPARPSRVKPGSDFRASTGAKARPRWTRRPGPGGTKKYQDPPKWTQG